MNYPFFSEVLNWRRKEGKRPKTMTWRPSTVTWAASRLRTSCPWRSRTRRSSWRFIILNYICLTSWRTLRGFSLFFRIFWKILSLLIEFNSYRNVSTENSLHYLLFLHFREFKIEGGGKENLPHACFEPLYLFTTIKFDLTWFATIKLC